MLGGVLLALVNGCTPQAEVRGQDVMKLQVGMSREEVLSVMGKPQAIETYARVEFWLYRADTDDGRAQSILPVGFASGRVTGWGRIYYEDAMRGNIGTDGSVPIGR